MNCLQCAPGYGCYVRRGYYANCWHCIDTNCADCSTNYQICNTCKPGYTLSAQGYCTNCSIANCVTCSSSAVCTACYDGYGVDGSNLCSPCTDANCLKCPIDNTVCTYCNVGFMVAGGVCSSSGCSGSQCSYCPTGSSNCKLCALNYGIDSSNTCSTCQDSYCLDCSSNNAGCLKCAAYHGVFHDTFFDNCLPCSDNLCYIC